MTTPIIDPKDIALVEGYGGTEGPLRDVPVTFHLPILLLRAVRNGRVPEGKARPVLAALGYGRPFEGEASDPPKPKGPTKPSASAKKALVK
jgi:hypothetical protein